MGGVRGGRKIREKSKRKKKVNASEIAERGGRGIRPQSANLQNTLWKNHRMSVNEKESNPAQRDVVGRIKGMAAEGLGVFLVPRIETMGKKKKQGATNGVGVWKTPE